jgi:hypothetical protein
MTWSGAAAEASSRAVRAADGGQRRGSSERVAGPSSSTRVDAARLDARALQRHRRDATLASEPRPDGLEEQATGDRVRVEIAVGELDDVRWPRRLEAGEPRWVRLPDEALDRPRPGDCELDLHLLWFGGAFCPGGGRCEPARAHGWAT